MTITEKVILADRYLHVFLTHAGTCLVIGIILITIGFHIMPDLPHAKHYLERVSMGVLICVAGMFTLICLSDLDNPFYAKSPARTDLMIVKYHHRLTHGKTKRNVNKMRRYLNNKKPQKPWLDVKF